MTQWIWLFIFLSSIATWAQDKSKGTAPSYKITGNALLMSQFIDRGLAISDRNPALNASFLFNLGSQFKVGFWGSNISNLTNADDNFWFKILAEIKIDFNDKSAVKFYINDDHFYKASIRNGQSAGFTLDFNLYTGQLEWMNNYQGTNSAAEYISGGRSFILGKDFKAGAKLGYTIQNSSAYSNYFDIKGFANYELISNSLLELGMTVVSDTSQFNGRGDPAIYGSFELKF